MNEASPRSIPVATLETEPYWAACRRHEFLLQRCADCQSWQFYPRLICCTCSSRALRWTEASGRARLRSFTIIHRPVSEAYASMSPYVVALVQLDEGPTMMSHVVNCTPEDLKIGLPLHVVFDDWAEGVTIPNFMPAPSSA